MLKLYKFYSEKLQQEFINNSNGLRTSKYIKMKGLRKDVIALFTQFMKTADPSEAYSKYLPNIGQLLIGYRYLIIYH